MQEKLIIQTPDMLKAMADPLRMDILKCLKIPRTVKNLSIELDKPATKLYYHVNLLEKNGLIHVVETNVVSGIIEKTYQLVARNFQISDTLLSDADDKDELEASTNALLQTLFGITQKELKQSIRAQLITPGRTAPDNTGLLFRSNLHLTKEQGQEFQERLDALLKEIDATSQGNDEQAGNFEPFGLTVAYYPIEN